MRKAFMLGISFGIVLMAWAMWGPNRSDLPYVFICGLALVIASCCNEALERAQEVEIKETGHEIGYNPPEEGE
jgi:hypothetical protein